MSNEARSRSAGEQNAQTPADPQQPSNTPQTPPPAAPPSVPAKSKFPIKLPMFVLIIIGIFLLSVSSIAAYLFFTQTQKDLTACTLEAKICPDGSAVGRSGPKCEFAPCRPTGSVSPTPDPMADWKTYEGDGFTFKYPEMWEMILEASYWTIKLRPDEADSHSYVQGAKEYEISISVTENIKKLSPEEVWKERIKDGTRTPGFETININGLSGIKVSNNSLDSHDMGYYFTNDSKIVLFSLNYFMESYEEAKQKYPNAEKYFGQILSTFKFIDSDETDSQRIGPSNGTGACGGLAGWICAEGYRCQESNIGADAGGKCVRLTE